MNLDGGSCSTSADCYSTSNFGCVSGVCSCASGNTWSASTKSCSAKPCNYLILAIRNIYDLNFQFFIKDCSFAACYDPGSYRPLPAAFVDFYKNPQTFYFCMNMCKNTYNSIYAGIENGFVNIQNKLFLTNIEKPSVFVEIFFS